VYKFSYVFLLTSDTIDVDVRMMKICRSKK